MDNTTRRPPSPPQGQPGYVMLPDQIAARARSTPAHGRQPAAAPQPQEMRPEMPFSDERRIQQERGITAETLQHEDAAYAQSQVSAPAIAAAIGSPALRTRIIDLEVPVQCSDGTVRTQVTLQRPKWGKFEEYLGHPLVANKKLSANSAMVAACAGVPLDFMIELDFFDGMNLTNAVMDFFPQALKDKLQQLSSQSSPI